MFLMNPLLTAQPYVNIMVSLFYPLFFIFVLIFSFNVKFKLIYQNPPF